MRFLTLFLMLLAAPALARTQTAVLAGGCFWCVESDFETLPGVISAVSGYTGGTLENPSYEDVSRGKTGHYEAVKITFDNTRLSYDMLLHAFFRSVDPTDPGGQFCDRGDSYRTAIFVNGQDQKRIAEKARADAAKALGRKIVTPILPATTFWPAEDYHQDYYKGRKFVITRAGPKRQSEAYRFYRKACGRDRRVRELWGDQAAFAH